MALINCPECKNQISENAPRCTKCGWVNKKNDMGHNFGVFIGLVIIITGMLMMLGALLR